MGYHLNVFLNETCKDAINMSEFINNLKDNKYCIAAYKKKQEFGPSKVIAPKNICHDNKILIQNHSSLIKK